MPFLPGLAIVFVGAIGGGHPKLHDQLKTIVTEMHGAAKAIPSTSVAALTAHSSQTKTIVKKLHADGVVGFELVADKELRAVTYGGDGSMRSYLELTLQNGALGRDDMKTLEDSIADDFSITRGGNAAKTAPVKTAPAAPAAPLGDDDEMPGALGGKSAPKRAPAPAHAAAPVETSSAADDSAGPSDTETAPVGGTEIHTLGKTNDHAIRAGAALGFGVVGRDFEPPPTSGIVSYSSTPVGVISAEGYFSPTTNLRVRMLGETTMSMQTAMMGGSSAPTSITRWEAGAGYAVTHGAVELSPVVGFGRRAFSIESTALVRSPDGDYEYLMAGIAAAIPVTNRITVRSTALLEPCIGGAQPTDMMFGDASRYAIALGASVEMRFTHVFARAGIDWQRFSWAWDGADPGEAGGATDSYTAGTLALGADY
jgi:hypothetical protein